MSEDLPESKPLPDAVTVSINLDGDVVSARLRARELGFQLGFLPGDLTLIATAVSELVRNIVCYAKKGEIILRPVYRADKRGIEVIARDAGPGIDDIAQAMQNGFSTSGGLGFGLPGVKRLMDEFEIVSSAGQGTTVTVRKWL